MIPKIIWQTHEAEYDDLEPFQKNVTNTWKNLNPGWNYKYISKTARGIYLDEFEEFIVSCYSELTGINQADLFKMLIVHKYGGFYADMDSVCIMPLDNIVSQMTEGKEIVTSSPGFQTERNEINCSNFGGIPNGQNLTKIIEEAKAKYKQILEEGVFTLKGLHPGIPTWLAFNTVNVANHETIFFNEDYFMHSEIFKIAFDSEFLVEHNGEMIPYLEFAELNNLPIY